MKAVIAVGGMGTRLAKVSKNIPKALVKVGNKPIIEHQIILLAKYGIKDIYLLLGYLGDQIKTYLGDGKKWGVCLHYHHEEIPLGRTGALAAIRYELKEDFLFLSGDIMIDFDIKKFINWHKQKKDSITSMIVHPSDHPFDSDLIEMDSNNAVTSLLVKPHAADLHFQNLGIASVFIFSPGVFKYIPKDRKSDFEKDVLSLILKDGKRVYAYKTPEYIKDMGTPERLKKVNKDYRSGKIQKLNIKNKRRAIFLDRDGVINEYVSDLAKEKEFTLYPFAPRAVKKTNYAGYLAIVVTNQPMVAKGFITQKELHRVHKKMEIGLGLEGAFVDAVYYCPHHPEKGFKGEVVGLKIKCSCRKPGIGLIKKAVKDFNIDLTKSFFIGDSTTDAKAAENAGIKFIGVKTGYGLKDGRYKVHKKFSLRKNVLDAVNHILK